MPKLGQSVQEALQRESGTEGVVPELSTRMDETKSRAGYRVIALLHEKYNALGAAGADRPGVCGPRQIGTGFNLLRITAAPMRPGPELPQSLALESCPSVPKFPRGTA